MKRRRKQGAGKGAQGHRPQFNNRQREEAEIQRLTKLAKEIPRYAHRYMLFRQNRRQRIKQATTTAEQPSQEPSVFVANSFSELPISKRTLDGLAGANFQTLTPIQRVAIPQALAGRDVLAAAPTGSGKTLAFLVPLLEILWQDKWSTQDGLAAIVISPTRELAMQIFDVLRKVGTYHTISAGLVIGGKDFEAEKLKVGNMNVLIATPGRLLHHMDLVAELDCTSVKMLVLDEADRILDMGFSKTLDAIVQNLPKQRQTLLFSATQTKDVRSLARLSLKDPEYVAISGGKAGTTETPDATTDSKEKKPAGDGENEETKFVGVPDGLTQTYIVLPEAQKLSMLWSFIKTHLKAKMIIFFSSTKQVRFAFEAFCKLRPGMSLLHLHGGMKQQRRADMYELFCRTKSAALLCTDVASRGLDFPHVEWVVQADCPDDVDTYIHRVGRTARLDKTGRAILFLSAGKQQGFLDLLSKKKIHPKRTQVNSEKFSSLDSRLAALVTSSVELRQLAQKAFIVYVNSLHRRTNKSVFDVKDLDFGALAKSFGLSVAPKVSLPEKEAKSKSREVSKGKTIYGYVDRLSDKVESTSNSDKHDATQSRSRKHQQTSHDMENDSEDEVLVVKGQNSGAGADDAEVDDIAQSELTELPRKKRRKERKLDLFKNLPSANRVVFDSDGMPIQNGWPQERQGQKDSEQYDDISQYAADISRRLGENMSEDKLQEKDRVRALRLKRKRKERSEVQGEAEIDSFDENDGMALDGDGSVSSEESGSEDDLPSTLEEQSSLALKILSSK